MADPHVILTAVLATGCTFNPSDLDVQADDAGGGPGDASIRLADAVQADAPYAPAEGPAGRVLIADGTCQMGPLTEMAMNNRRLYPPRMTITQTLGCGHASRLRFCAAELE